MDLAMGCPMQIKHFQLNQDNLFQVVDDLRKSQMTTLVRERKDLQLWIVILQVFRHVSSPLFTLFPAKALVMLKMSICWQTIGCLMQYKLENIPIIFVLTCNFRMAS